MRSKSDKIVDSFHHLFDSLSEQDKLDNEAKLLMFRFLEIIEKKRLELGWTRKQLAEQVGTSASYITQLFRGDKLINMTTLAKMENILDIEFEITESVPYQEQVQAYTSPVADGKGFWIYRPLEIPDYENREILPKNPDPKEKVA